MKFSFRSELPKLAFGEDPITESEIKQALLEPFWLFYLSVYETNNKPEIESN